MPENGISVTSHQSLQAYFIIASISSKNFAFMR